MKYKSIIILALTIFVLISIAGVSAAEANDTVMANEDTGDIELSVNNEIGEDNIKTSENNTLTQANDDETVNAENDLNVLGTNPGKYSELASEIGSGGNIILQHDYYTYDYGSTISISDANSVIDGNGAVIDMAGSTIRAFNVDGSRITIKNLTIKNVNYAGDGGAIYFSSYGAVENCNFADNSARYGGAIYFSSSYGTVGNCNFTNNVASDRGGAVHFYGNGVVVNCNFIGNNATIYGGAIYFSFSGTTCEVRNCNFADDSARYGGAVYFFGNGVVVNCNFTNNAASEDGGAVYCTNTVINCNFINNKATGGYGRGGAIYMDSGSVGNCNFTNNYARYGGGAIYFEYGSAGTVENCNFNNNTASSDGGAIDFESAGTVTNCNFTGNNATTGSAIYFDTESATKTVSNSRFLNNRADAEALEVTNSDNNITITFIGKDNLLNAICSRNGAEVTFTDVTYWSANGIATTGSSAIKPPRSNKEAGQNITLEIYDSDSLVDNVTLVTDDNGQVIYDLSKLGRGKYRYNAYHLDDSYYTYAEKNNAFIKGLGDFNILQNYINAAEANSIITLNCSYTFTIGLDENLTDGIVIDKPITINGNCYTINALQKARIFNVTSGNVVLNNITFTDATASGSGAVYFSSSGSVINCNFTNNKATDDDSYGGAIFFVGTGNVTNCNFTNNYARYGGGAIYFYENGDVTNCNFTNNYARYGGAIRFNGEGNVTNCNFTNNKANGDYSYGGAIYMYSGSVENCNFTNNKATGYDSYGGAIFSVGTGNVTNCNFIGNSATFYGGAIYFSSSGTTYEVRNCNFTNNAASNRGGAVYFNGNGNVTNCNFTNNTASSQGGAIWMYSGSVENCNFTDNKAADYWGGAIYFNSNGNVTNCNFVNNTASSQGGAIRFSNSGTVTNCNFTNNSATINGGAVHFLNTGNVTNCNFTNNSARYGGAVYFYEKGYVTNCNFTNNKATGDDSYGGAIYFYENGGGNVTNCNFIGNSATFYGGAIYFSSSGTTHEVRNCNFTNNSASYDGGAIRFNGEGNVTNCNFINNKATGDYSYGGAIYMYSGSVENCNFTNNKATGDDSYGGAIFSVGAGNVTNCNFIGNNATFYGGAIYFSSSGTTYEVRNCNFTNNSATINGGAVYFLKTGNVTNCNFADNSASNGMDIYSYLWSTADTCIFKSSDTSVNIDIFSPTLNVGNFTTFYGSGEKLTFDLKTNSNIPVTNGNISISVYFKNNDNWVRNYTCLSGEGWIPDLSVGSYYAIFNTEYAGFQPINRTVEITIPKIKYYINVTSLTTNNKTVNITAKSNIPKDILWDGKLLFILPNTNSITANYAGNGTWWALHTFDDYAVYEVNATYTGLDNVTINNATITISRANSTLTVDDIVFDYNTIGSTTVSYTGATGINASVINQSNAKVNVDGNTITVSGLNAGTYTLSVTTMADADHNNVTKTANITVNKLDSTLTVDNIVFDYNSAGYTLVSFSDASGVNVSVVGQPNAIVRVVGNVITVSGLNAGTYSLSVTTITDANHNSLTKTAEITVNKLKTSVSGVKVTTTYGTSKNMVITLKDVKDNLLAGKYVTVVLGGTTYKNKLTNSKGQITIAVPKNLVPKTSYTASLAFGGDNNYAKSTGSVNVEVKKATPKLTATKKTFKKSVKTKKYTVTLKDNSGKVMKNTKVTLKVKGRTYKATTNAKGKATFKIKNLKKKGKFTATVKFAGNVYYNAATKKVKIIVK